MTQNSIADNRMVWLDVVRCVAMLMVIGVHCIDPFYISPTMRVIPEYTHWAAIYGSLLRPSVPLFVMMTGLLLLPVRQQPLGTFYKKRIFRVLFPFLIWSVLYSMFPWFTGVLGLPENIIGDFFCYTQGHESQALGGGLTGPHGISDLGYGFVPENFNAYVVDNVVAVNTTDAQRAAQKVLRTDAIPASVASGAVLQAAAQLIHVGASRSALAILPGRQIVNTL